MNKGREKSEETKRERGRPGLFLLSPTHNSLAVFFFFSCSLLYALPALSERLEQVILALEDSSAAARNKDTKTTVV